MRSIFKRTALAALIAAATLLVACGGGEDKPAASAAEKAAEVMPIKIGAMIDLSGPTSEVGNPYADGIKACVQYLNDSGGIAGRPLELLLEDTGYKAERGQDIYNRFVFQERRSWPSRASARP